MQRILEKVGLLRSSYSAILAGAAVLCLGAGAASASPVESFTPVGTFDVVAQTSNIFKPSGGTVNGYDYVHITNPLTGRAVDAGGFALKEKGVTNSDFIAFCLDVAHYLTMGTSYAVTTTPFEKSTGGVSLKSWQTQDIQTLFNAYYDTSLLANKVEDAGFQVALWEIVNEKTRSYDLGGGDFMARNTWNNGDVTGSAQDFLNKIINGTAQVHYHYQLTYLQSVGSEYCGQPSQNLITAAPVPLPATGFLLLSAIGGFGFASRRRRRG